MNINELESFKLSDAVKFRTSLNPVLFSDGHLRSDVREKLLQISEEFVDYLGINNLDVDDITLSGSNAAYTYTDHSDVDLHILVDMNKFNNDEVYRELFSAKKNLFNNNHDIKIRGYDVELYVQDKNEPVKSLGEFSVLNNKWIRLPVRQKSNIDVNSVKNKVTKLVQMSDLAMRSDNIEQVENLLDTIRRYRQAGLDKHGEFGPENIAFKILRTNNIINNLYNHRDNLHSKQLSLAEELAKQNQLDNPTLTIDELSQKHGVRRKDIIDQLVKGIKVEMEHTSDKSVAREIAMDHLGEDPEYYTKLLSVQLESSDSSLPSKIYHVTLTKNLKNIMTSGLKPRIGDRSRKISGEQSAIYCFPDKDSVSNALMNWLGDEFDEDDQLALLSIDTTNLHGNYTPNAEYEISITDTIPPENIKILSKDVDSYIFEASGYIPSESEKNDPRWEKALSVDVRPDTMQKNATKFGWKIARDGRPPLLRK